MYVCARVGYKLSKEEYLKNLWIAVNKPTFQEEVNYMFLFCVNQIVYRSFVLLVLRLQVLEMSRDTFDQMGYEHEGYITQEEYIKFNAKRAGEENALAAFKAMKGMQ